MAENPHVEALKEKGIPTHPKWQHETDFGEYGAAVYYYSDWDVGPEDYAGDSEEYDHVSNHMHGYSLELRHAEGDRWDATFSAPTPWGENHEPDKTNSKRGVSLNEAINHINHLLSAGPAGNLP